jgi:hypothetical protein
MKTLETHQTFLGNDEDESELQSSLFFHGSNINVQHGFRQKRAHTSIKVDNFSPLKGFDATEYTSE